MERSPESSVNRSHHPVAVFLRGMAMGAADIVPGVSGGTIAFITGIYFRLLEAISAAPVAFVKQFLKGDIRGFWRAIDGSFLITLLAGVITRDRKSTRLNSSHVRISYAVFCLKKKMADAYRYVRG